MTTEQKREVISKLYGKSWTKKVRTMTDEQVVAVFFNLQKSGKINN